MDFPLNHNTKGWDSAQYKSIPENPSIKTEMEGGYMISRPRHTRTPRRTFNLGWKSMSNADKVTLDAFYDTKRGSSATFTWYDPATSATYTVRFKDAIDAQYVGKGSLWEWDCKVVLEQV